VEKQKRAAQKIKIGSARYMCKGNTEVNPQKNNHEDHIHYNTCIYTTPDWSADQQTEKSYTSNPGGFP